jgi:hypothetical protein
LVHNQLTIPDKSSNFTHLIKMLHDVLDDITARVQVRTDRDDATSCFKFAIDF